MKIILALYLIGLVLIPIIGLYLNHTYKWVTKRHLEDDDFSWLILFAMGIVIWPVVLISILLSNLGNRFTKWIRNSKLFPEGDYDSDRKRHPKF